MTIKREPPTWLEPERKEQWEMAFGNLPKRKKKSSPANELTNAIMDYAKLNQCAAARINVMGIYDQSLGKYRKSGSTIGVEDINITYPLTINGMKLGLTVAVEVKIGKDEQSEAQKKRQDRVEKAGGVYIIAKTFDTFKADFDSIKYKYHVKD